MAADNLPKFSITIFFVISTTTLLTCMLHSSELASLCTQWPGDTTNCMC